MGGKPCLDKMNPAILLFLQILRIRVDRPMTLTSTYRDEAYNKLVGGGKTSQHLLGNAADVSNVGWTGAEKAEFVRLALDMDLSVGIYKTFFHIDCRNTRQVLWTG